MLKERRAIILNKEEYIKKMLELGWDMEYIEEQIKLKEEAKNNGIDIPFEFDLVEKPIEY